MHSKNVVLISGDRAISARAVGVLDEMDVQVSRVPWTQAIGADVLASADLVVADMDAPSLPKLPELYERLQEDGPSSLLLIVDLSDLGRFSFDARVPSDFIVKGATDEEFQTRAHNLLWPGEESTPEDFIRVDNMTINLATYQVKVNGEPIDFTYLEYALLAFLVTHPGRTYSRDALLRRVWGFEYYGGSRTVDVHVRRVRSKLGPDLAARLKTVRGVGYLWSM